MRKLARFTRTVLPDPVGVLGHLAPEMLLIIRQTAILAEKDVAVGSEELIYYHPPRMITAEPVRRFDRKVYEVLFGERVQQGLESSGDVHQADA